jgi:hypothetical protein
MIIWHDPNLARVFREEFARCSDKLQAKPMLANERDY